MKTLVAYFSAESGRTAGVAEKLAAAIGAFGKKDVPVEGKIENFAEYEKVLIGFPIWYGCAPNVVNTFCSGYDWSGKKVAAFATSGGSGIGKTAQKLAPYVKGAEVVDARVVNNAGVEELKSWAEGL